MESLWNTRRGVLLGSGLVIFLTVLAFLPARWIGLGGASVYDGTIPTEEVPPLIKLSELSNPDEDTDGDGFPNWRELALGTNQNDATSVPTAIESKSLTEEDKKKLYDTNNLTTQLAKNNFLATRYLTGDTLTEADLESLSLSVITETAKQFKYTSYTEAQLKDVRANMTVAVKETFGNNVAREAGMLVVNYLRNFDEANLYAILQEQSSSTKASLALTKKASDVQNLINKLLTIPVPSDAVETHLTFINALARYKDTLTIYSQANYDPLKTIIVLRQYKEHIDTLATSFRGYGNYFAQQFIVFTSEDDASIFTHPL